MANTTKIMREFGDKLDLIERIEKITIDVLNHLYDDTYNLEQLSLENKIINKDKVKKYSKFIND